MLVDPASHEPLTAGPTRGTRRACRLRCARSWPRRTKRTIRRPGRGPCTRSIPATKTTTMPASLMGSTSTRSRADTWAPRTALRAMCSPCSTGSTAAGRAARRDRGARHRDGARGRRRRGRPRQLARRCGRRDSGPRGDENAVVSRRTRDRRLARSAAAPPGAGCDPRRRRGAHVEGGAAREGSGALSRHGGQRLRFARALARTGDEIWLHRARAFATHSLAQVDRQWKHYGRGRFGLWTGDLGPAIYAWQCTTGDPVMPTLGTW